MSDGPAYEITNELLALGDEELGRTMRAAMLDSGRDHWADADGAPYPRLELDDPPAPTDDPLLAVGYALLAHLPEGWEFALLTVSAAADEVRTYVTVRLPGGDARHRILLYLPDVAAAALALRRATYEPDGRGAWYGALIRLDNDGRLATKYDYDGPPFMQWGPGEVELLRRDHELYPRDPEHLPPWHPVSPTAPPA
ncbi:hypothetical protein [Jiangella anatolica]|uniref:Uncharacterized protein n=1 Tax=Jiangella anatolica TaxID=2670374 RepID=A0A2W2BEN0_9ACTN|nr:hypothetical protein [Jiangella anatolica]PZF84442.1 hypothetical protein C1I92_08410 [Jiangella anatolica]